MTAFDAIVIGLGAHGSAAALALTRRGLRVLGIERFERGHELGSSGGRSRMIRRAYFEHLAYIPLLAASRTGWDRLAEELGEPMVTTTGGLYIGGPDGDLVSGSIASAREQGVPHEVVDADEIRRRWPAFTPDEGMLGVVDPGAGIIDPQQAIEAQLRLAEAGGAELRFGERVLDWRPANGGIEVETGAGVVAASRLVIAAGAWTSSFVPDLKLPLEVERMPVFWFEPPGGAVGPAGDRLPVWIVETTFDGAFYGFPYAAASGLKVARHYSGQIVDPGYGRPRGAPRRPRARPVVRASPPARDRGRPDARLDGLHVHDCAGPAFRHRRSPGGLGRRLRLGLLRPRLQVRAGDRRGPRGPRPDRRHDDPDRPVPGFAIREVIRG